MFSFYAHTGYSRHRVNKCYFVVLLEAGNPAKAYMHAIINMDPIFILFHFTFSTRSRKPSTRDEFRVTNTHRHVRCALLGIRIGMGIRTRVYFICEFFECE